MAAQARAQAEEMADWREQVLPAPADAGARS
jgi:hypothetical protein